MVQYSQINKNNIPHKQNERQKSHDHINRYLKAFDKVQHPFMIKKHSAKWNTGIISQQNEGHIQETYSQHYTQWAKAKSFPTKIRNNTRMSAFTTFIQHSIRSSSHSNQTRKTNKGIQIGKEEIKLSLFADDIILYI